MAILLIDLVKSSESCASKPSQLQNCNNVDRSDKDCLNGPNNVNCSLVIGDGDIHSVTYNGETLTLETMYTFMYGKNYPERKQWAPLRGPFGEGKHFTFKSCDVKNPGVLIGSVSH